MALNRTRFTVLWLLIGVCLTGTYSYAAQQVHLPVIAQPNPRFTAYVQRMAALRAQGLEVDPNNFGLVPEPIKFPASTNTRRASADNLPATYDLRTIPGKLPDVRNQGGCGSCWAFAAYGSLESCLRPAKPLDFSENHLKNNHGFNITSPDYSTCCSGGNRLMATAYLVRWGGPVYESDDPYNTGSCTSPSGLAPRMHIQDVVYIPDRADSLDNAALKRAVMTYGAVYTTFYYDNSYYKSSTHAYYSVGGNEANHAVCIIGWDDNYLASNFTLQTPEHGTMQPPGNGAFIVRNSWGTGWGESGYFYMSYYDSLFGIENAAFIAAEPADNYTTVYQYDPLGAVSDLGYQSNTGWFGMMFTATADSTLSAVSWYTSKPNSTYELYVYSDPSRVPTNGDIVAAQSGTLPEVGYHTVKLVQHVDMTAGTKYGCVVKLTTPGYDSPITFECPMADYGSDWATANRGETFVSANGQNWTDMVTVRSNSSVCIKAFASLPLQTNISELKAKADGAAVNLTGMIVSAVFADCIYVEDANRISGIRVVVSGANVQVGDVVNVTGTLSTHKYNGVHPSEREITNAVVTRTSPLQSSTSTASQPTVSLFGSQPKVAPGGQSRSGSSSRAQ
ncbi:MAG: lectin like domain-containing protein [Armatimonadota bacterium]|nr:lectin like domain-containing protein [bacterium]